MVAALVRYGLVRSKWLYVSIKDCSSPRGSPSSSLPYPPKRPCPPVPPPRGGAPDNAQSTVGARESGDLANDTVRRRFDVLETFEYDNRNRAKGACVEKATECILCAVWTGVGGNVCEISAGAHRI